MALSFLWLPWRVPNFLEFPHLAKNSFLIGFIPTKSLPKSADTLNYGISIIQMHPRLIFDAPMSSKRLQTQSHVSSSIIKLRVQDLVHAEISP
mmetsp:Transcript_118205/g.341748  ORF Transcript_118205/g.341748 Transcript_118205/m.341748 type:complete len:93 (+) Transcript_118205:804-1082(+)